MKMRVLFLAAAAGLALACSDPVEPSNPTFTVTPEMTDAGLALRATLDGHPGSWAIDGTIEQSSPHLRVEYHWHGTVASTAEEPAVGHWSCPVALTWDVAALDSRGAELGRSEGSAAC